jgi:hypothetical protein
MFFKTQTFVVILVKIEIKVDPTLGVVHSCVCPVFMQLYSLYVLVFFLPCCPSWLCSLVFCVVLSVHIYLVPTFADRVGTNFADMRRSFGRYSSLAD